MRGHNAARRAPRARRTVIALLVGAAVVVSVPTVIALAGGFADAPAAEPAHLDVGAEHRNDRFAVTVTEASVADENDVSGHLPDDGERILAVRIEIENISDEAFSTTQGLRETILVPELGDDADVRIARVDDGTRAPWLQPGLPAILQLSWVVADDAVGDGDAIDVLILDPHRYVLSTIASGTTWRETTPGALIEAVVRDDGAEARG